MDIVSPLKSDIQSLRLLWKEAFSDTDEYLDIFFDTAFSSERSLCVKDGKTIVAMIYWFECEYNKEPAAYLYAVATKKEFRGRGICRSLMKKTHGELLMRGYKNAFLVPAKCDLYSFYEGMGYTVCSYIDEYEAFSDESSGDTMLLEISSDAYFEKRRKLLPENSVIQEKECKALLEKTCGFYLGNGFIFAYEVYKGELYIKEYLGEKSLIPVILQTIGYEKGYIRTPGGKKSFGMSLSLCGKENPDNVYFGFALD